MSPVTIPALTTTVDRQFKENRTLRPVRALRYYLDRTLSLESSQHIYKFLPKRPYLVRQQHVSGTSGDGTTSARSFPSDHLSSEKGGGGHSRYNQVFRSLIPGSRYRFTSQDVTGKVIFYF